MFASTSVARLLTGDLHGVYVHAVEFGPSIDAACKWRLAECTRYNDCQTQSMHGRMKKKNIPVKRLGALKSGGASMVSIEV